MKSLYFFIFILLSVNSIAQSRIDSLLIELDNETDISKKIDILDELSAEAYEYSIDSAIYYNIIAVELSIETENDELTVNQLHNLAKLYIYNSNSHKALEIYEQAVPFAKKSNNQKLYALSLHSLGNGYYFNNDFNSAIEQYIKALNIREAINDTIGIAASTNNIGMIYWKLKQNELALEYYTKSLEAEILIDNKYGIASSYNNIGMVYWQMDSIASAITYVNKSLKLKLELNATGRTLSDTYSNLGVLYRKQEMYDSSLFYFQKILPLIKQQMYKHDIANAYTNIATSYSYLNNNSKALLYLDSAITIAKQINDFEILRNAYQLYSSVYVKKLNYKQAYTYLKLYTQYKDSLFNENMTNQIAEMQTKYESEKKEHEIELQQKEIELQNLNIDQQNTELKLHRKISYVFLTFTIIILALLVFLTRLFFQKKKTNSLLQLRNVEITQQKEEIETQANNLNDAFDKIRISNDKLIMKNKKIENQKDILKEKNEFVEASIRYASTIQNASLPLSSIIDQYFDNFIIFLPKDIVSGDFYFFSSVKRQNFEELYFVVSDCTGHGVPGAFMSMIGIRLLNKYINEYKIESPAKILENINNDIIISLKQNQKFNQDGMDMIICKFIKHNNDNNKKIEVTFAGAKRDLYYYDTDINDISRIRATRKSIGGHQKNKSVFTDNFLETNKNNSFFLFSKRRYNFCFFKNKIKTTP